MCSDAEERFRCYGSLSGMCSVVFWEYRPICTLRIAIWQVNVISLLRIVDGRCCLNSGKCMGIVVVW